MTISLTRKPDFRNHPEVEEKADLNLHSLESHPPPVIPTGEQFFIHDTVLTKVETPIAEVGLKTYLESFGNEVIDKREKGGVFWLVGNTEIHLIPRLLI